MKLTDINITTSIEHLFREDSVLFSIVLAIDQKIFYSSYKLNREEINELSEDSIKPILEAMLISIATNLKTIKE